MKLSPVMMERLEKFAELYGMPAATLAAFALAEWINGKETTLQTSKMVALDVGRKIGGVLEEQMREAVGSTEFAQEVLRAEGVLSQRGLPLDSEASRDA